MKTIVVLPDSEFSIKNMQGTCSFLNEGQKKTMPCIAAKDVFLTPSKIKLLNPIQSLFVSHYIYGNAMVCAPTSAGKTLIASFFIGKHKTDDSFILYVVPTRALARDIYKSLKPFFPSCVLRLSSEIENQQPVSPGSVVITTIDSAVSALRNNIRWAVQSNCIVIDELHTIVQPERGILVEEIVTFAFDSGKNILALSATMPGALEAAQWINCSLFLISLWRPVPLVRTIEITDEKITKQQVEPFIDGKTILFASSKKQGWSLLKEFALSGYECLNNVRPFDLPRGTTYSTGKKVAFHCAEIPLEDQKLIETTFVTDPSFNLLIATSTLAYGINLPADRVVIIVKASNKTLWLANPILWPSALDILQMEGRAGRFGLTEKGSSVLLISGSFKNKDAIKSRIETIVDNALTTSSFTPALLKAVQSEEQMDTLHKFVLSAFLYKNPVSYLQKSFSVKKWFHMYPIWVRNLQIKNFLLSTNYLTKKGTLAVKSNCSPDQIQNFLNRASIKQNLLIDTVPLIKEVLTLDSSFVSKQEIDSLVESERLDRIVQDQIAPYKAYISPDDTQTKNLLLYCNGVFFFLRRVQHLPPCFSRIKDTTYLIRVLTLSNSLGLTTYTQEEIAKLDLCFKKGIPYNWALLGMLPGAGYFSLHALIYAIKAIGLDVDFYNINEFSSVKIKQFFKSIHPAILKNAIEYALRKRFTSIKVIQEQTLRLLNIVGAG